MKCLQCNRRVKETFQAKWNHMIRYHTIEFGMKVLPLLFQPEAFVSIGQVAGEYAKDKIKFAL